MAWGLRRAYHAAFRGDRNCRNPRGVVGSCRRD
jgi:hypothetical protein